ncbi:MAG: hypothetical protein WCD44_04095 [Candidatus Babeliales bacterium]
MQAISTCAAEEFPQQIVRYQNASVTAIHWTRDGTTLVLLGKERRRTGTFLM